jgi:predicted transcriptional regulator
MEQNQNPLIRFLDDSTTEMIKNIKDKAKESLEESAKLKKTLSEAQIRIAELMSQL